MDTPLFLLQRETPVATGYYPALSVLGRDLAVDMLLEDAWCLDDPRVAHLCDCAVVWADEGCECDHESIGTQDSLIEWATERMPASRPDWDAQAVQSAYMLMFDGPQLRLTQHAPSQEYAQLSPSVMRLRSLGEVW